MVAKQVLDHGVYGIVWPHVSTVDEARNAVVASRYPRPREAAYYEPAGQRGDAPAAAARYWGLSQQDYYKRADVWPLNPEGEVLVAIMCEEVRAIRNLPKMLEEVPGSGRRDRRRGDLSQDLGLPRQYEHPPSPPRSTTLLAICKAHNVPCGHPHVDSPARSKAPDRKGFSLSDAGAILFVRRARTRPQSRRPRLTSGEDRRQKRRRTNFSSMPLPNGRSRQLGRGLPASRVPGSRFSLEAYSLVGAFSIASRIRVRWI